MTEIQTQQCSRCKEVKPLVEGFHRNKRRRCGYCVYCKNCVRIYELQYYHKNKHKVREYEAKNRDKIRIRQKEYHRLNAQHIKEQRRAWFRVWYRTPEGQAKKMLSRIRRRAKAKGVPFNLTLEDIKLPVLCPVLGIPLDYEYKNGRLNSNSPSLDRRIPELGYVKGNVEVISMKANTIKAYATPEEIARVARYFGMMA